MIFSARAIVQILIYQWLSQPNWLTQMYRNRITSSMGFTLVEVLITVAIIGILATVAYPGYQQYVIRSHRADAQSTMSDIANREQQFLIANRAYASKTTLEASGYSLPANVSDRYSYDITLGAGAAPSFVITFTATGSQASDGVLTLSSDGDKTPAEKWK